ncbi:MAG: hypothetical protein KDD34_01055 [Bdellovibrionales bacterium]|nr:hypothetical protein [Bdellovibrionales bacterium]
MAKILLLSFFVFSTSAFAESELAELVLTHTLIRNQTILYKIENIQGELELHQSELFQEMTSNEDCSLHDKEKKYSSYVLLTIREEAKKEDFLQTQWVGGNRIEGQVVERTTQLCFAL